MAMRIAEKIVKITTALDIPYTFKGSFKKANRSRIDSFTGIGDEKALKILQKVSLFFYLSCAILIFHALLFHSLLFLGKR